jgi:hypothetical protein
MIQHHNLKMSQDPTKDSFDLKMYTQRKASVEITPGEPQFIVRYVGRTEVYIAIGHGCTQTAVQKIWDDCYDEKGMDRVSMLINSSGIILETLEGKSNETVFPIKDIAYCSAERGLHDRVFAWICKDDVTQKLQCHAVLCSAPERAQLMALTLHRSFHIAYKDWKHQKEKKVRAKAQAKKQSGKRLENNSNNTKVRESSTFQDSESVSEESDAGSIANDPLMETLMARMNLVEEEEISLTEMNGLNNGMG